MLRAEGDDTTGAAQWRVNGRPASAMTRSSLVPFFVMHYGIFWFVHGVFVLTLPLFMGVTPGVDAGPLPDPFRDRRRRRGAGHQPARSRIG